MKNLFLYLTLSTALFILFSLESCSTDSSFEATKNPVSTTFENTINLNRTEAQSAVPANKNNPYDAIGSIHTALRKAYYASDNLPKNLEGISKRAEAIGSANAAFSRLKGNDYQPITSPVLRALLSNSKSNVLEIIQDSKMTTAAQSTLAPFLESVILLSDKKQHYSTIYNFIVNYEATILANKYLTKEDKGIILRSSSLVRYAIYAYAIDPPKKDPDWKILITNIVTANQAEAVMTSLAVDAAVNQ